MIGVQFEGNLLAADITTELLTGNIKGQTPADFGLPKSDKLEDEIAIAWGDAKAYWASFQRQLNRLDAEDTATSITREMAVLLLKSLGYTPVYTAKAEVVEGQTYAISHRAVLPSDSSITNYELRITNYPPIHIIGCRLDIDKRPPSGTPRLSAHGLVQEYLNKTEHLWAIATNGFRWRLLRDSSLMTRLTYIEFDLEQILNGENFAEFGLFYRLFHRSRLPETADDADKCLLEYYHQESLQQGGRVRDRLRDGVEKALIQLGNGFIQHRDSENLRQKLSNNYELRITNYELYRQLLRLIYRLLFLMVAESRNLLLIGEDPEKARIYLEYYSIERLRELAERPRYRREGFQDIWQGLRVTFKLFDENWRGRMLGLSPLNGDLFGSQTLTDLDDCGIDNYDLLTAIRCLSLYEDKGQIRRVNYAALDVEELGSVYESLLDFHPQIKQNQGIYEFNLVFGSDRKTTGSYYTPPQLVQQLIKTALEPVIEEKLRQAEQKTGNSNNYELRITNYELSLLSLKVIDPACGSGHFLLAAARRIGKELAKVRTGESQPAPEPLRQAVRDVIQNCIYGVDLNPLAVDLCKVALWIEGFATGKPLNFLDHRIKCGNSLVGVLDLDCLDAGIPDDAFKAVTGDDKKLATDFKKRNKKERETQGQLSIFETSADDNYIFAKLWQELADFSENTPQEVKEKERKYQDNLLDNHWWLKYVACNLWTSAFFRPLTEHNLQLLPTTATIDRLKRETVQKILNSQSNYELRITNYELQALIEAANKLAKEKSFFHWPLEFPEVFNPQSNNYELRITNYELGFDCVLGNPPWERIKLQEKEFFASRNLDIANAQNKAAREKLIKELPKQNPALAQAFEDAKHDAEAQSKFIREGGRFPLTAVGDINTYSVFAETTRKLINDNGRVGVIVPSGIATNDTTKDFFADLIKQESLVSLLGFTNWDFIFPDVGDRFAFCLLTLVGKGLKNTKATYTYHCHYMYDLNNKERYFSLSKEDINLINPNTFTCPVFRSNPDAELTKKIYQNVPVLENENTGINPWGISFMRMFDMANDSGLFKNEAGKDLVPLYEAKMFFIYNHRYGYYTEEMLNRGQVDFKIIPTPTIEDLQNFGFTLNPRYWLDKKEVENKLSGKWDKNWLLGWRDITNSTNERTAIFSLLPLSACGDTTLLMFPKVNNSKLILCLIGSLNSLVFDFVARQKVAGTHLKFFTMRQLPVIPPEKYTQKDIEFITPRVLELVYTSWDMQPFAQDMGYNGEPFIWNPNKRALIRAELDAYYAKLYQLTRDELRYILDPADVYGAEFPSETFRVLKNNEIKKFGEYRTQRLVLEAWDRIIRNS
ncbi:N-6 DNA methylase [Dolichospermum sp. ST_con]|nr:N-6 DNA methylase [Dolichospermum sp. ST_con]MDD1421120.1 N-6 DNA methylase [Dolichospermum sp. ST_sed1]MDD1427231.1 N-6 DNA methylase [Dolichospermum sp. ST_sed9]MDD1432985.1 N-6 DNA methylase [Dolichospermum sp. ST_sed6]MDD1442584.1 N-6 DNA methylase [Dolichospermum sp. ST_sed3]MDD1448177.1 N-6 DNA methylase [Dolichospermum sp. ST_sed8]MDD1457123.1 N-6 DNA methylase [Dolichospermum sp. ST_sed7]MDD1462345.1 N-6 DNA methylase [Dolichospermum sp. ST_sed2]MDD1473528.1 N-6 DNA methylase [Do